ncbi:MAG: hypothetical protein IPL63_04175 [Saprospiraceae bacterium]|nr:hypothetical protein [Saprospiraceae bacterium]MBK7525429.1 hypothetical protein [Saprospiraceae bacterium]MBK8082005.1 hypothetical protein [Saprospiraceae bacterium]MBK8370477.1 hypothetical protein [Saprospiraceae bacterium]MBK8546598.1 hypothetical protein [Saprospiraceae bacterium]
MKVLKNYLPVVLISVFLFTVWNGCIKAPDLDNSPEITNISLSKNNLRQGSFTEDSIIFIIEFTDGDGNFGSKTASNIFISDSRKENLVYEYKAPPIPEQGTKNGVRGTLYLTMYSLCCFTENNPSCCADPLGCPAINAMFFNVKIQDRSGNFSNSYATGKIDLMCL